MTRALAVLVLAAGCAGDDPDQHDLTTCTPSPAWDLNGNPAMHVERCELACVDPPTYTGAGCAKATCQSGEGRTCLGNEDCTRTFVTADGATGCCDYGGSIGEGLVEQFLECE